MAEWDIGITQVVGWLYGESPRVVPKNMGSFNHERLVMWIISTHTHTYQHRRESEGYTL